MDTDSLKVVISVNDQSKEICDDTDSDTRNAAEIAKIHDRGGLRCIEFFSGIGGMRYGVEEAIKMGSRVRANSTQELCPAPPVLLGCKAYEISLYANETYAHNFKDANVTKSKSKQQHHPFSVCTKLVEQLKPSDVDGVSDLWTMSPPCQPFTTTRYAKQLDSEDERCKGFKGLMDLLRTINGKPRWILLENVKGFVGSAMLSLWHECLRECGYSFEEYLLSPTQIGIPNHRTRYYMICERSNRFSCRIRQKEDKSLSRLPHKIFDTVPDEKSEYGCDEEQIELVKSVSHYLLEEEYLQDKTFYNSLLVPDDVFEKNWAKDLGVVSPLDHITHCFTAAYARQMHKATGSLLLVDAKRNISVAELPIDRSNMNQYRGKLRRFGPSELLKLFGFPIEFEFPQGLSLAHQFKLIGNSVNVSVVACVASFLLKDILALDQSLDPHFR